MQWFRRQRKKLTFLLNLGMIGSALVSFPAFSQSIEVNQSQPAAITYLKYGEWVTSPQWNPPSIMWRNNRMQPDGPSLYICFLPDRIYLYSIAYRDIDTHHIDPSIILYIKDKHDKLAINLSLKNKNDKEAYYNASIYGTDRDNFVQLLTTSRKARLILPSAYSQTISLHHVSEALRFLFPEKSI